MIKAALYNSANMLENVLAGLFKIPFFRMVCLFFLVAPVLAALVFAAIYFFCCLYGLVTGQYYPSREFFQIFPAFAPAFQAPEFIAKPMVLYAAAGACVGWSFQRSQGNLAENRVPDILKKYWPIWSLPVILSLLLATLGYAYFSYSAWPDYSFCGILPVSDAHGHYSHPIGYFYNGVMRDIGLRRPPAAILDSVFYWLSGNNPACALALRCLLAAFAMWASCMVVNRLSGIWSAICCLALEYCYVHTYVPLFQTELLGFFWGCLAVTLWLQTLRTSRLLWLGAAFGVTLLGLLTRMGSMFLVPLLFLYGLWLWRRIRPGRGWWKMPLASMSAAILAVFLLNSFCSHTGKAGAHETGSNFAHTFVGLTLGKDWSSSYGTYGEEIKTLKITGEKEIGHFFYRKGIENLRRNPEVFIGRLLEGEVEFLKNINFFLFNSWYFLAAFSVVLIARRKWVFTRASAGFWGCVWLGILLSIPFIYFDCSWRANIFVYPFLACFFSLALCRTSPAGPGARAVAYGPLTAGVLALCLMLLMAGVALFPSLFTSSRIEKIAAYVKGHPSLRWAEFLVTTEGVGFLVIPDDEVPNPKLPEITWSVFKEKYEKLVRGEDGTMFDIFPRPPFYIFNTPPVAPVNSFPNFIAPPEVMRNKDVLLWKLRTSPQKRQGRVRFGWHVVTKAEPVLRKE